MLTQTSLRHADLPISRLGVVLKFEEVSTVLPNCHEGCPDLLVGNTECREVMMMRVCLRVTDTTTQVAGARQSVIEVCCHADVRQVVNVEARHRVASSDETSRSLPRSVVSSPSHVQIVNQRWKSITLLDLRGLVSHQALRSSFGCARYCQH